MIILKNDYLKLEHHTDSNTIISSWCQRVNPTQYRQGITYILDAALFTNAHFWLTDSSLLDLLEMSDQRWTIDSISNTIHTTNIQRIANVVPDEIFHQIISFKINAAVRELHTHLEFDVFTDRFAAFKWLISTDQKNKTLLSR